MDSRRKRILFRAWRRGFREIDLILGGFADAHLASLRAEELDEFELLLDTPDPDLYAWIVGLEPLPEGNTGALLRRLRSLHAAGSSAS